MDNHYLNLRSRQPELHFNREHLETATAFSLCEGDNQEVCEVGGYPIRKLCDFLLSLKNPDLATYKFATALQQHKEQQLIRAALSEIELIAGDYITIVCFGSTQPRNVMRVNAENQCVEFGKITRAEISMIRAQLQNPDWNGREDTHAYSITARGVTLCSAGAV